MRNWTLLGQLYLVSSVTPLDIKLADQSKGTDDNHDDLDCRAAQVNSVNSDTTQQRYDTSNISPHLSSINLEGRVEESDSFAKDGEIGNAGGLLLDINLEDASATNLQCYSQTLIPRSQTVCRRSIE